MLLGEIFMSFSSACITLLCWLGIDFMTGMWSLLSQTLMLLALWIFFSQQPIICSGFICMEG
jgi:hypothetical protein